MPDKDKLLTTPLGPNTSDNGAIYAGMTWSIPFILPVWAPTATGHGGSTSKT